MASKKVITYELDQDSGLLTIYCNLIKVVEWSCDDTDSVEYLMDDFKKIFDLGVSFGSQVKDEIMRDGH
jgi:hypothetical protein